MRAPAELWTAAISTRSDRYTMDERGVPSVILMERASLCVSRQVVARLADAPSKPVGVLVGPGNNGGDGLAVARQLHGWGLPVDAWMVIERERYPEAVAEQLALARAYGTRVHQGLPDDAEAGRLWVDGLLGTGSRGAPRGRVGEAVAWLVRHRPTCIAIDLPTGIDPDTGAVQDQAVRADSTVTFARSKAGLHITPGRAYAGAVVVADIGLMPPPEAEPVTWLLDPLQVVQTLTGLPAGAHKGQRGHVGVVGGSPGTTGAALLAGVAALRAGAGLVTVASPDPGLSSMLLAVRPELMSAPLTEASLLPRADALVVGPGLTDPDSPSRLPALFVEDPRPALWDASALDHVPLRTVAAGPRVITPHPGEAARLMQRLTDEPWSAARVQAQRLDVARRLAEGTGSVVVLKGPGSLVATPDGRVSIGLSGGPALATAGSGDVLAGLGGALLARLGARGGADEVEAATAAAVHIHGVAGDGLRSGSVAMDVAEALPDAMARVMAEADYERWPQHRLG